jgi:hypothetical protein
MAEHVDAVGRRFERVRRLRQARVLLRHCIIHSHVSFLLDFLQSSAPFQIAGTLLVVVALLVRVATRTA